jgi:YHS domain-containing protein
MPVLVVLIVVILGSLGSLVRAQTNEYCPVTTSEKADPNIFPDYQGKRIHFCCNKCKRDFMANPEQYMDNLKIAEVEPVAEKVANSAQDSVQEGLKAAQPDDGHDHDHTPSGSDSDSVLTGAVLKDDHGIGCRHLYLGWL